jgi:hypothetical protein
MPTEDRFDPEFRVYLRRLERQLRVFQIISLLAIGVLALTTYFIVHPLLREYSNGVLRVRGIIVEDEQGHERILLGAPVPQVSGRKRKDAMTGVLVLGQNGAFGALSPDLQTKGALKARIGAAAGLAVNDENGNERGGFWRGEQ